MRTKFALTIVLLAATACNTQTDIQRDYTRAQRMCQGIAETTIEEYLPKDQPVAVADRNAQMVTLFSNCMAQRGWQVAKPKKADEVANAPAGAPSYPPNQPSATAAAKPAQPAAIPSNTAETTPLNSAPPTTNPASLPWLQNNTAPVPDPSFYGTGPGRRF